MEEILGFVPPEGLDFEASSSRDERKKQEQEERQKLKEQRDAVTKEAQEQLQEGQQTEGKDDGKGTENNVETSTGDAQEYTAQDYTEAVADESVLF